MMRTMKHSNRLTTFFSRKVNGKRFRTFVIFVFVIMARTYHKVLLIKSQVSARSSISNVVSNSPTRLLSTQINSTLHFSPQKTTSSSLNQNVLLETNLIVHPKSTAISEYVYDKSGRKVILLAYTRGGSTFLGQLFALNSESFYWFEIVQPMYLAMSGMMTIPTMELYDLDGHRRQQSNLELDFIFDNLDKYFSCQFDRMPYEMLNQDSIDLSGAEWTSHTHCVSKETGRKTQYHINKCLSKLSVDCRLNAGTAYKVGCFHAKAILDGRSNYSSLNFTIKSHVLQSMKRYKECLTNTFLDKAVKKCLPSLMEQCNKTTIRATKILRLRLSETETLVKQHPDLKIIHQIRDPRGALLSTQNSGLIAKSSQGNFTKEANLVCPKMLEDVKAYKYLKEKYPNNYLQIKYEDNAADPVKMLDYVYSFIGMGIPTALQRQVYEMTHSKTEKLGDFNTRRTDSNATAHKWRTKIKPADKIIIDRACNEVLETANYMI